MSESGVPFSGDRKDTFSQRGGQPRGRRFLEIEESGPFGEDRENTRAWWEVKDYFERVQQPSDPATLQPFRAAEKLHLVLEILRDYLVMWRALGLPDVRQMAARARSVDARPGDFGSLEHQEARRLGKVVGKTLGVLPTDSRCLIRSLVLLRVLARRVIPGILVIGVRKQSEFEAHAWVEHDGEPILPAGEYTRLTEV